MTTAPTTITFRQMKFLALAFGGRRGLREVRDLAKSIYKPPGVLVTAGTPGHNEHGVPLHACNGHRHDEHYWAWLRARRLEELR